MSDLGVLKDNSLVIDYPFLKDYRLEGENPVLFGAVYYRRSNPPESDWERDYKVAVEDGHTIFRHWLTWNSINVAPGVYDFEKFDRHMELAVKYNMKTIAAEHIYEAPDWLYHKYPHARVESVNGNRNHSMMGASNALGITRMCLDNPEVMEEAQNFLYALGRHYKDNPGLFGYDIWNECSLYNTDFLCYCPATQQKFREWLKVRYHNDLDTLKNAWRRYSITCWEDIELPRQIQPFPDTIDMVEFYNDNAQSWFKMRDTILRKADPNHVIVAHGNAKTFSDLPCCGDDYAAGKVPDIFGYTFWYDNKCSTMLGSDMIRIASGGKEFWRAEAIGNSDWKDRGGVSSPILNKELNHDPQNIRMDALMSLCAGSRAFINPRWRALQDGPLLDAFGWYNLDGSRSERSEEIKSLAQWANSAACGLLWKAQPIRGEVGLLMLDEAQVFCYSFYGSTEYFSLAYQGAYEAFLDSNIQADPIRLEQIDSYKIIYLPFPVSMSDESVMRLQKWVEAGGTLICEGCPGFVSKHGHAYETQPPRGMDKLFGCIQDYVNLGPDMWHNLTFSAGSGRLPGGVFRQSYILKDGKKAGQYDDGQCAIVENTYGAGKTRLIGTMAGYGYKRNSKDEYRRYFASALAYAGVLPVVETPYNTGLIARIWTVGGDVFLWCINTKCDAQHVLAAPDLNRFEFSKVEALRGSGSVNSMKHVEFDLGGRDACVFRLVK